jgi:hypothetical protein
VSHSGTNTVHYNPLKLHSVFVNQMMINKSRPKNQFKFCGVIVLLQLYGSDALKNTKSDINRIHATVNKCY